MARPKQSCDVTGCIHLRTPSKPLVSIERGESVGEPKKTSLGKYCVAGGPGNVSCTTNFRTEGISMHNSPEMGPIRRKTSGKLAAIENISTVFHAF